MGKNSDEIKRIMASLPDAMVKCPVKIPKKKTRMEELEDMRRECSDAWDREYAMYLSGEKNLATLLGIAGRQIIIDRDWLNEGYRINEEKLMKKENP